MKPTQRVTSACFPAQLQAAFPVINFPFCCLGKFGDTHSQQNLGRDPPPAPIQHRWRRALHHLCAHLPPTLQKPPPPDDQKSVFFPVHAPLGPHSIREGNTSLKAFLHSPSHEPAKIIITEGVAANPQAVSTLSVCPSLGLISNRQVI